MPAKVDIRAVFRDRLRAAREAAQLSQKQLGIKAGLDAFVASTRINRYETGVHEPDLATVERMAAALDLPAAYFFASDDRLARLIRAFHHLSVSEKEKLLRIAEETGDSSA
jgi:transcriptional regulator with XRE-family HTH domain